VAEEAWRSVKIANAKRGWGRSGRSVGAADFRPQMGTMRAVAVVESSRVLNEGVSGSVSLSVSKKVSVSGSAGLGESESRGRVNLMDIGFLTS
jgi:hypothetical protein